MRLRWLLLASLLAVLVLAAAACADEEDTASEVDDTDSAEADDGDDHDHDDHDHDDHDHDHDDHDHGAAPEGAEEVAEPMPRLLVADATEAQASVIDLVAEESLATLDTAGPSPLLMPAEHGRHVALIHPDADAVEFVDGGTWAVDHGDHAHYYVSDPAMLDAGLDIGRPIHHSANAGQLAIFADATGTVTIVDEAPLDDGELRVAGEIDTGAAHHGGVAILDEDLVVVSGPEDGQDGGLADEVWLMHDGEQVGTYACPGLHGELAGDGWAAFACADRILVVEGHGDHGHEMVIDYPEELGDGRVGYLAGHPGSEVMIAASDDVLVVADAASGEATALELPAPAAARASVDDDGNGLVLTDDGALHLVDPEAGEVVASSEERIELDDGDDAPRLSLVGGRDRAYVPDPAEGLVHEFATNDDLRLARSIDVGGQPAGLAYLGALPR